MKNRGNRSPRYVLIRFMITHFVLNYVKSFYIKVSSNVMSKIKFRKISRKPVVFRSHVFNDLCINPVAIPSEI
jgi:hypothetical protein